MPVYPWGIEDDQDSNVSPESSWDSEHSYVSVGELQHSPQWVQWFTTMSSRNNTGRPAYSQDRYDQEEDRQPLSPSHLSHSDGYSRSEDSAPSGPWYNRSQTSPPGGRSVGSWDQDFGFARSQSGIGGRVPDQGHENRGYHTQPSYSGHRQGTEEEWSTNQLVWPGGEAPRLYSPWHQHVQPGHNVDRAPSPKGRKERAAAKRIQSMRQKHVHPRYTQSQWGSNQSLNRLSPGMSPTEARFDGYNGQPKDTQVLLPESRRVQRQQGPIKWYKGCKAEYLCVAIVATLLVLLIAGVPISVWLFFKYQSESVSVPTVDLDGSLRITNWQFTTDLASRTSDLFRNRSLELCTQLNTTFLFGGPNVAIKTCEVINFSNGSVISDFRLGRPLGVGEDPEGVKQALGRTLSEAITTGRVNGHRVMEDIEVDPTSIKFLGDDKDECKLIGMRVCAPHPCLDLPSDYSCQCQPGYVLKQGDTHKCVEDPNPPPTTTTASTNVQDVTTVQQETKEHDTSSARPMTAILPISTQGTATVTEETHAAENGQTTNEMRMTTSKPITVAETTKRPATTERMITSKPSPVAETTKEPLTTVPKAATLKPTTKLDTTTGPTTTEVKATTSKPTTVADTTKEQTTTDVKTTTSKPTTVADTTKDPTTTEALITTSKPTTVADTTKEPTTTEALITTSKPTTIADTTKEPTITEALTTTPKPTTVANTTKEPTTTEALTTTSKPTTVADTTKEPSTTEVKTTTSKPTTVAESTKEPTMTEVKTTTSKPTTVADTTKEPTTTEAKATTSKPTTVADTTKEPTMTEALTTTSKTTTVADTTKEPSTTEVKTTTSKPTTVAESTKEPTTTEVKTTTSNPTTVADTTKEPTTTEAKATTSKPTTVADTTKDPTTTEVKTTTSKPTTVADTTKEPTTTEVKTTTSKPTTVADTTKEPTTTEVKTTTSNPTTVADTTKEPTTTEALTTTSKPTTVADTTKEPSTTEALTTTSKPTTVADTTKDPTTTEALTTTSKPTTVADTTKEPTTTKVKTTSKPTTVADTTQAPSTTETKTTTSKPTTAAETTMVLSTIVSKPSTSKLTVAPATTKEPTTIELSTTAPKFQSYPCLQGYLIVTWDGNIRPHDTVRLSCEFRGSSTDGWVQWYRVTQEKTMPVNETKRRKITTSSGGLTTTLTYTDYLPKHDGEYMCMFLDCSNTIQLTHATGGVAANP